MTTDNVLEFKSRPAPKQPVPVDMSNDFEMGKLWAQLSERDRGRVIWYATTLLNEVSHV